MAVPYIFTNGPGHLADATQVNADFAYVDSRIDGISAASAQADAFQAGVLSATDWVLVGKGSINAGSGELGYVGVGGAAWLPSGTTLIRTFTASSTFSALKPPALPATGKWMSVGVELTAVGTAATLSVVSGAEQASEAAAIAAPPAVSAGKTRILDVVIKNTGGVYTVVVQLDRRPWARGARAEAAVTGISDYTTVSTTPVVLDATNLQLRVECSGRPVRIALSCRLLNSVATDYVFPEPRVDKAQILPGTSPANGWGVSASESGIYHHFSVNYTPGAGTHIFHPYWSVSAGEGKILAGSASLVQFSVEELRTVANNGTS